MTESEICQAANSSDDVFDIESAARFLKCGTSTLYHYVCNKKIPFIKMGSRTLFKRSDLVSWLDRYRQEPKNWDVAKVVSP